MRQLIRAVPDGVYAFEDFVDDDGIDLDQPLKIRASCTLRATN